MTLAVLAGTLAASAAATPAKRSTSDVQMLSDRSIVTGWSALVRTGSGISTTIHASQLPPGTADTVWWVVFNEPDACNASCDADDFGDPDVQASSLVATGHVVGGSGVANYGARLAVGDASGAVFGPGLLDPWGAEVHLVIRTHGELLSGQVDDQIHSFGEGCNPEPENCKNLQFSIHLP